MNRGRVGKVILSRDTDFLRVRERKGELFR